MTINAINGLSDITGSPAARLRDRQKEVERTEAQDSLEISAGALQAAEATHLAQRPTVSEIRMEQVEAAKQRIQDGSYKVAEVVLEVAARIAAHM